MVKENEMLTGDPEKDTKIREAIGIKPASPTPRIIGVPINCGPEFCIINGVFCKYSEVHNTYLGRCQRCLLFGVDLEADENRKVLRCEECLQAEINK